MNEFYHDAVDRMQALEVREDYVIGWIGGYLHNPKIEEQRITDAYEAGYADGGNQTTDNFADWVAAD